MRQVSMLIATALLAACASVSDRPVVLEADAAAIATMCAQAQCIHDVRVELKQEDGSVFSEVYEAMPAVQESGVSVYAGNAVYFEADVVDGRLVNMRLVKEVVNPERTVTSRLEQGEDGHMMLITNNPFDKPLRIRMGIMPLSHDGLVRTSSCPVIAGGSSFELWPYPIFQAFLADMRLIGEDEPAGCIE